jgi:hypothetical protein
MLLAQYRRIIKLINNCAFCIHKPCLKLRACIKLYSVRCAFCIHVCYNIFADRTCISVHSCLPEQFRCSRSTYTTAPGIVFKDASALNSASVRALYLSVVTVEFVMESLQPEKFMMFTIMKGRRTKADRCSFKLDFILGYFD